MTAPLTPQDRQPPFAHAPDEESGGGRTRREVRDAVVAAVLVGVCGVVLGLLWLWLSPRVPLVSDGSAIYLKDSEGEQAVGADGWFTLLGLALGAVTAGAVYWWRRAGGAAVVIGLAVGGALASLLAWRMGVWLGPPQNVVEHARRIGPNKVFSAPLQLRAKGALLAWPIASMAVFLGLTSVFSPHDEPEPESSWEGWEDPRRLDDGASAAPEDHEAPENHAASEDDETPAGSAAPAAPENSPAAGERAAEDRAEVEGRGESGRS